MNADVTGFQTDLFQRVGNILHSGPEGKIAVIKMASLAAAFF
jgi:hypothetical protein